MMGMQAVAVKQEGNGVLLNMRDVRKELAMLVSAEEPAVTRWIVDTWNAEKTAIKYQEITEAVKTGLVDEAWIARWQEQYSEFVSDVISPIWEKAAETGANNVEDGVMVTFGTEAGPPPVFRAAQLAIDDLNAKGLELAVALTDNQRKAMQGIIKEFGVRQGLGPFEVARYLRPAVGLTPGQAMAVANFRASLIADEILPERIERLTQSYAAKLHRSRANMIARTEISRAHVSGQRVALSEYIDNGTIPGNVQLVKVWLTSPSEGTCLVCAPLDGARVPVGEEFPTGDPPIHPNCQCDIFFEVKQ